MDHCAVSLDGQVERRSVEGRKLRVQFGDAVDERCDELSLGSVADMGRTERINEPMIILLMRDQRANADNRVVDMLWEFVPEFGTNFVVALTVVTICRREAREIRYCLNVPYEHVWHVRCVPYRTGTLRSFNPRVIYCHKSVPSFRMVVESIKLRFQ